MVHALGFNGCGVQEITASAGVPKGSFYNYFESKEALAVEVLDTYWQSIEERFAWLLSDPTVKPLTRIQLFFRGLAKDHEKRPFSGGCLIGNLALELSNSSAAARKKIRALLSRWEHLLAKCLREAQSQSELDKRRDAAELAAVLIEAYEGAVMRGKVEQDWTACDRFVERVLPRLLS